MSNTDNPSELLFQGNADFLSELFRNSTCIRDKKSFKLPSGPITCSQTLNALHNFCENYKIDGQLNYRPIRIKMDSFLESLCNKLVTEQFGLVFHYGYDTLNDEIVYILSKGKLHDFTNPEGEVESKVSYCSFSSSDIPNQAKYEYLLLKSNSVESYDTISSSDFQVFKEKYMSQMLRRNGANFENLDAQNHPKLVYHNPAIYLEFFNTYRAQYDLYLYIAHGAIELEKTNMLYHVPCFIFGDRKRFFFLDNEDHSTTSMTDRFKNKAFDIGRLCPPHCRDQVTPCTE